MLNIKRSRNCSMRLTHRLLQDVWPQIALPSSGATSQRRSSPTSPRPRSRRRATSPSSHQEVSTQILSSPNFPRLLLRGLLPNISCPAPAARARVLRGPSRPRGKCRRAESDPQDAIAQKLWCMPVAYRRRGTKLRSRAPHRRHPCAGRKPRPLADRRMHARRRLERRPPARPPRPSMPCCAGSAPASTRWNQNQRCCLLGPRAGPRGRRPPPPRSPGRPARPRAPALQERRGCRHHKRCPRLQLEACTSSPPDTPDCRCCRC